MPRNLPLNSGHIALLVAGTIWGTTGLYVRALCNHGWQPLDTALARAACSLLLLTAGVALLRPRLLSIRREDVRYFLLSAVSGTGTSQPMFMLALVGAPLAVAVLLNYTAPLFVVILARLFLKERFTSRQVLALALSTLGLALVTGVLPPGTLARYPVSPLALVSGLGSGFFYAVNILALRRLSGSYSPATVQIWAPLMGLPLLGAARTMWSHFAVPATAPTPEATVHTAGIVFLMAVGPGLAGFLLVSYGLSRVQAGPASILLTVEPLVAAILGWLILRERLSAAQVAGMVMVLGAICTVSLERMGEVAGAGRPTGEHSPHAPGTT